MRSFFLVSFLFFTVVCSNAQERDSSWVRGGNVALFLQQVGLKDWAGGGENALSYGSSITLFANLKKEKYTWNNSFEAGYGVISKENSDPRKNLDLFILQSSYGRYFSEKWQFSANLDFRSQFAPGYKFKDVAGSSQQDEILISDFLAPGYLQTSLGLTYKPNAWFNATFSPLASKIIFVYNDSLSNAGAYGVTPGENVESQFGTSLRANVEKELMENVNLKSNLLLFGQYSDLNHIDIFWDVFIDMKINKWLTANVQLQMIYDHEIKIEDEETGSFGPRTQIRNVINVGIGYRFGDSLKKD